MNKGKLTLIYGCMFAGKTTELLKIIRANKNRNIQVFKPSTDNRSPTNKIKSHNSLYTSSFDVKTPNDILQKIQSNTDTVLIDEIQFFPKPIIEVIETLVNQGRSVVGAGLLLDSSQNYFGAVNELKNIADHLIELYALCNTCSSPAEVTYSRSKEGSTILTGGSETYAPLCLSCHNS